MTPTVTNTQYFKLLFCALVFAASFAALAGFQPAKAKTVINNDVNIQANTGGNQGAGESGRASAEVDAKTVINGQTVEDTQIKEQVKGKDTEVKVQSQVEADKGQAEVETQTSVNGQKQSESKSVQLSGGTEDPEQAVKNGDTEKQIEKDKTTGQDAASETETAKVNADNQSPESTSTGGTNQAQSGAGNGILAILDRVWDSILFGVDRVYGLFA